MHQALEETTRKRHFDAWKKFVAEEIVSADKGPA